MPFRSSHPSHVCMDCVWPSRSVLLPPCLCSWFLHQPLADSLCREQMDAFSRMPRLSRPKPQPRALLVHANLVGRFACRPIARGQDPCPLHGATTNLPTYLVVRRSCSFMQSRFDRPSRQLSPSEPWATGAKIVSCILGWTLHHPLYTRHGMRPFFSSLFSTFLLRAVLVL